MSIASAQQVSAAIETAEKRAITPISVRRVVHSCWCDGNNLHIIFTDGMEMIVTWGDKPEIRGVKNLSALPAAPITEGPISAQLSGKTVEYCYINEDYDLLVRCTDDHECVITWQNGPKIRSMNVKLMLEMPPMFGTAQSF